MIILKNGKIIRENDILENHSVLIEDDKIKKIVENDQVGNYLDGEYKIIDCSNKFISPGFIDIHSDYIENIISPRPVIMMDYNFSLHETERILVTSGITTIYHSLSLYPFDEFGRKEVRNPKNIYKLIDEIQKFDKGPHIIHNRLHLRYEICGIDHMKKVEDLIKEGKVHLLSFMNHVPGQGQYKDLKIYGKTLVSYDEKLTQKDIENRIHEKQSQKLLNLDEIEQLAKFALENKVKIASHDDDSIEKLCFNEKANISISEFPITLEIAKEATRRNMWTVCGAPNIILGKSHSGNLSAIEGIIDEAISIISSDYYPSAVLSSIFKMHEEYGIDLTRMFRMVTSNPARAVGIFNKVGSIEEGKHADILLIEKKADYPVINLAMVDGHIVYRTSYRYD
ncbi:MAG: alpha-D-ribose 1-methylphosphonate 5-triphosphate diphosphatase [Peptoniphilus lacydonensis]|uniref:alpha-D-ribose 1-methylphosphonate 5-triphosphate diphosphatase n=1 Tax=Peptoniphilaceae TaxID=1570339 RepID=UPI00235379AC|nr:MULTISPECIES: alpha-D-ribose 1-methylphosphonate 5-triphosphate diphosphatase [Peptoniphilus]MDU1954288.1 alpha-D-ribose 1-methylphosphonate 5-triphosphate diphosphatase [Peptoniphilus lacydonensis]MDU5274751.1 alpha-D-ribose 1-methylphosphonate 5-triphosphate diphosphatase [Peptoniphilus lacydonensis]